MSLWERHLLFRFTKTTVLILLALFCVYFLVDLSIHSVRFLSGKATLWAVFLYYAHCFSMQLDLFFALAFLLAVLKQLSELMQHSECIALSMAGVSHQRLMRPLFLLASFLMLFSYANTQWIAPTALDSISSFREKYAKRKKQMQRETIHNMTLDDGSEIVYQRFNRSEKILFDVYWIRNAKDFWHMQTLELTSPIMMGHFVEHLVRQKEGALERVESYEKRPFSDLPLDVSQAFHKFTPFDQRPLFTLLTQSFGKGADRQMILAHLHYKLSHPLLLLLIALALPPILLRFSRQRRPFLIAACSLFALLSFITILDGMLILSENRVVAPSLAIWTPWISALGAAFYRFFR